MFKGIFLSLLLLSSQAFAADWQVREKSSSLGFAAIQLGAEFQGAFQKFSSEIVFDENDLASSHVKIEIDIASVDTKSHERDTNILTADWFHAEKFPKAVFATREIKPDGKGGYIALADLTMRDVTKPVSLPFNVEIDGETSHAKGELTISRTDYGIGQGQWAADTVVGDSVRIFFDLKSDAK